MDPILKYSDHEDCPISYNDKKFPHYTVFEMPMQCTWVNILKDRKILNHSTWILFVTGISYMYLYMLGR